MSMGTGRDSKLFDDDRVPLLIPSVVLLVLVMLLLEEEEEETTAAEEMCCVATTDDAAIEIPEDDILCDGLLAMDNDEDAFLV